MVPSFELHVESLIALEYSWQNFFAGLNEPFGPASLLGFEGSHFYRQFCRTLDILQISEFPAFELPPIRKVGVFGERIVLPAPGVVDRIAPPHSRSAVEVEKDIAASPARV